MRLGNCGNKIIRAVKMQWMPNYSKNEIGEVGKIDAGKEDGIWAKIVVNWQAKLDGKVVGDQCIFSSLENLEIIGERMIKPFPNIDVWNLAGSDKINQEEPNNCKISMTIQPRKRRPTIWGDFVSIASVIPF